jgi:hypothetical protein
MLSTYEAPIGTVWVRKDGAKNPVRVMSSIIQFNPAGIKHPTPVFQDEETGQKFILDVSGEEEFRFFYKEKEVEE